MARATLSHVGVLPTVSILGDQVCHTGKSNQPLSFGPGCAQRTLVSRQDTCLMGGGRRGAQSSRARSRWAGGPVGRWAGGPVGRWAGGGPRVPSRSSWLATHSGTCRVCGSAAGLWAAERVACGPTARPHRFSRPQALRDRVGLPLGSRGTSEQP